MQQRDPTLGEQVSRPDGSLLASDPSCRLAKGIWVTSKCRGGGIGTGEQRQGECHSGLHQGANDRLPSMEDRPRGQGTAQGKTKAMQGEARAESEPGVPLWEGLP